MTASNVVLLIAAAALAGTAGWFAHEQLAGDFRTYPLPNGHTVVALRHLDQVYPLYAKSFKAQMDVALDQKATAVKTTAGGKYEDQVTKLYENLDAISADVRTTIVAAYTALILKLSTTTDPAQTDAAFKKWDDVLDAIIKETAHLREINLQLAAAGKLTSSNQWEQLAALGDTARRDADALKALLPPKAP